MFGREPAVLLAALVAVVQGVMIFVSGNPSVVVPNLDWLLPVLTILGGVLVRRKVTPTSKLREAGISETEVDTRQAELNDRPDKDWHI